MGFCSVCDLSWVLGFGAATGGVEVALSRVVLRPSRKTGLFLDIPCLEIYLADVLLVAVSTLPSL